VIPVEQRQLFVPDESTGDCWKCCIASVLELPYEDVPHFAEMEEAGTVQSYWNTTQEFLRPRGFLLAHFGLWGDERPYLTWGGQKPAVAPDGRDIHYAFSVPGHWIAGVVSPRTDENGENIGHVVVMNGSEITWDPHPHRDEGHLGFTDAYLLVAV
jgi:hypothetical protein